MIEEFAPGFYQVKLPFPRNPLRDLNIYFVKGKDKNLMVDTGFDIPEVRDGLEDAIKTLGIDLAKTEFLLTHMHVDHTGNIAAFANDQSVVYFSREDAALLNYATPENKAKRAVMSVRNGFPPGDMTEGGPLERESHPMLDFAEKRNYRFSYVEDGEVIRIGDFAFRCVMTPGHTKGHTCLFEPSKKILLSGDHILQDITPNISTWSPDENPLAAYLSSLDKVYNLDVELVLPAHRRTMTDLKGRVDELKRHHEARAKEAYNILAGNGKETAFEVASHMTWDVKERTWETVPIWQKMFAVGEAMAHLRYLTVQGKIYQDNSNSRILFSVK